MLKLNTEAISSLGCNIASGIVLEQLIHNKSKKLPIYFNVKTLFRNYVACLDGNADEKIKILKNHVVARPIIKNFIEDTSILVNAFIDAGYDIKLYNIDYKPFLKNVFEARKEEDLKGLKSVVRKIESLAISYIKKDFPGIFEEHKPKVKFAKEFYIVTHIGIELLNFTGNKKVTLIESHTGEMKDFTKWYSKYAKIGSRRMDIFGFNELLYNILGDNEYVKPTDIKLRKHIFNIAIENAWTSDMSENEVRASIKRRDPIILREIERNYKKYFK